MGAYRKRLLDDVLESLLFELPAIELYGAKAVGKTSSARRIAYQEIKLDLPDAQEIIKGGIPVLESLETPLLIDEWQRHPPVWDYVRRIVDDRPQANQFILTGSSIPRDAPVHSGAGRIVRLRMRPYSLQERELCDPSISLGDLLHADIDAVEGTTTLGVPDYLHEIVTSGFPALHDLSARAARAQLDGYVENIVQKEFADSGHFVRKPDTLLRWLRAYAAATGSTASYQAILRAATPGDSSQPSKITTQSYRDTLDGLWVTDRIDAWLPTVNDFAILAKSPKHYLVDPALSACLLSATEEQLLLGAQSKVLGPQKGSLAGRLFEALVAQSLMVYAEVNEAELRHFRSAKGDKEIDFIIIKGQHLLAIEVKLSNAVFDNDVATLSWLKKTYTGHEVQGVVVNTGTLAYTRPDGIHVIPAALLGA